MSENVKRMCPECGATEGILAVLHDIRRKTYFARCSCRDCGLVWDEVVDSDYRRFRNIIVARDGKND